MVALEAQLARRMACSATPSGPVRAGRRRRPDGPAGARPRRGRAAPRAGPRPAHRARPSARPRRSRGRRRAGSSRAPSRRAERRCSISGGHAVEEVDLADVELAVIGGDQQHGVADAVERVERRERGGVELGARRPVAVPGGVDRVPVQVGQAGRVPSRRPPPRSLAYGTTSAPASAAELYFDGQIAWGCSASAGTELLEERRPGHETWVEGERRPVRGRRTAAAARCRRPPARRSATRRARAAPTGSPV